MLNIFEIRNNIQKLPFRYHETYSLLHWSKIHQALENLVWFLISPVSLWMTLSLCKSIHYNWIRQTKTQSFSPKTLRSEIAFGSIMLLLVIQIGGVLRYHAICTVTLCCTQNGQENWTRVWLEKSCISAVFSSQNRSFDSWKVTVHPQATEDIDYCSHHQHSPNISNNWTPYQLLYRPST